MSAETSSLLFIHLHDPRRQRDVSCAVADIAASRMEAHDGLDLEPMPARLLKQLHVRAEIVLLRAVALDNAPPGGRRHITTSVKAASISRCAAKLLEHGAMHAQSFVIHQELTSQKSTRSAAHQTSSMTPSMPVFLSVAR